MPIALIGGGHLLRIGGTYRLLLVNEPTPFPPDITINYGTGTPYGEKMDTNVTEFQPDVGPPKRRRRMSISTDLITFSLIMKNVEWESFKTFYRTTLADGTLPFTFPLGRTGVTGTYVFSGEAPAMQFVDWDLFEVSITMRNIP